jgi:hypothetical protein
MKRRRVDSARLVRIVVATAIAATVSMIALLPAPAANASTCSLQTYGPSPDYASQYSSYKGTLFTNGGVAPYSYALANGSSLPPGLFLSKKGVISGVPLQTTAPSYATFDLQVSDSATPTTCSSVFQARLTVFRNNQIPTTDELVQIVQGLVEYGPECVLSAVDTLVNGVPPNSDCIGVIPF